jgi:hypothetical protein
MTGPNRRAAAVWRFLGMGLLAAIGVFLPSGCSPNQEGSVVLKTVPDAKSVGATSTSAPGPPRVRPRQKAEQVKKVFSPG